MPQNILEITIGGSISGVIVLTIGWLFFTGPNILTTEDNLKTIVIDSNHHHLGDVTRFFFDPDESEGLSYTTQFNLSTIPSKVSLFLMTKHVDPDKVHGPIPVEINGYEITHLNNYVSEETLQPTPIEFEIPQNVLKSGTNTLKISSNSIEFADAEGNFIINADDIEFWDLKLILDG